MTDLTDVVASGGHNSERFRAELLLQLPQYALRVEPASDPAGVPSEEFPGLDLYDQVQHDRDYDPEALAAWILEGVAEAYGAGVVDGESGPMMQSAAEVAAAAGRLEVYASVLPFVEQLAAVLKQGQTIAAQWDLARNLEQEAAKMRTAVAALVNAYPALAGVLQ